MPEYHFSINKKVFFGLHLNISFLIKFTPKLKSL